MTKLIYRIDVAINSRSVYNHDCQSSIVCQYDTNYEYEYNPDHDLGVREVLCEYEFIEILRVLTEGGYTVLTCTLQQAIFIVAEVKRSSLTI